MGERDDRGLRERVEKQKQKYAKDRSRLLYCTSADIKRYENNLKSAFLLKMSGGADSMLLGVTVSLEFPGHLSFRFLSNPLPSGKSNPTNFQPTSLVRKINFFRFEELLNSLLSWKMKIAEARTNTFVHSLTCKGPSSSACPERKGRRLRLRHLLTPEVGCDTTTSCDLEGWCVTSFSVLSG